MDRQRRDLALNRTQKITRALGLGTFVSIAIFTALSITAPKLVAAEILVGTEQLANPKAKASLEELVKKIKKAGPTSDVKLKVRNDLLLRFKALMQARTDNDKFKKTKVKLKKVTGQADRKSWTPKGFGDKPSWTEVVGVVEVSSKERASHYVLSRRTARLHSPAKSQPGFIRELQFSPYNSALSVDAPLNLSQQICRPQELVPPSVREEVDATLNAPTEFGVDLGPMQPAANELFLFSGSPALPEILTKGFNERFGQTKGLYGGGCYFTESPAKADQYNTELVKGNDVYATVLSRVTLGRTIGTMQNPVKVNLGSRLVDLGRHREPLRRAGALVDTRSSWLSDAVKSDFLNHYSCDDPSKLKPDQKKALLRTASTIVGMDQLSTRDDGFEFIIDDGKYAYPQFIVFYQRVVGDSFPDNSSEVSKLMPEFVLRKSEQKSKLFGAWSMPAVFPRKFYKAERPDGSKVRMFVSEAVGRPEGLPDGTEIPKFLYVQNGVAATWVLDRAYLLPIQPTTKKTIAVAPKQRLSRVMLGKPVDKKLQNNHWTLNKLGKSAKTKSFKKRKLSIEDSRLVWKGGGLKGKQAINFSDIAYLKKGSDSNFYIYIGLSQKSDAGRTELYLERCKDKKCSSIEDLKQMFNYILQKSMNARQEKKDELLQLSKFDKDTKDFLKKINHGQKPKVAEDFLDEMDEIHRTIQD